MSITDDGRRKPWQIDPPGCGCTECLVGEYVPLDQATEHDIMAMAAGVVSNASGFPLTAQVTYRLGDRSASTPPAELVRS